MRDGSVNQEQSGAASATSLSQSAAGASDGERLTDTRLRIPRGAPPINIRLSLPILNSRFYFAVVGGRERRSRERLAVERRRNRIATTSNILFMVIGALALYLITLCAFLTYAAVTTA